MKAQRQNRGSTWCAWLAVSGLVGLALAGPVVAAATLGGCAALLGAEEVAYRRRARSYFADLRHRAENRHNAVLDAWLARREGDPDRASTRIVDDVDGSAAAAFVEHATAASDLHGLARPDADHPEAYERVLAYDSAVTRLEASWRRLEARARLADAPRDASAWVREHVEPWLRSADSSFATFVRMARDRVRPRA